MMTKPEALAQYLGVDAREIQRQATPGVECYSHLPPGPGIRGMQPDTVYFVAGPGEPDLEGVKELGRLERGDDRFQICENN